MKSSDFEYSFYMWNIQNESKSNWNMKIANQGAIEMKKKLITHVWCIPYLRKLKLQNVKEYAQNLNEISVNKRM